MLKIGVPRFKQKLDIINVLHSIKDFDCVEDENEIIYVDNIDRPKTPHHHSREVPDNLKYDRRLDTEIEPI